MEPKIFNIPITRKVLFEKFDEFQAKEEIFVEELNGCEITEHRKVAEKHILYYKNKTIFRHMEHFDYPNRANWFDIHYSVLNKMGIVVDGNDIVPDYNSARLIKNLIKKYLNLDNCCIYIFYEYQ